MKLRNYCFSHYEQGGFAHTYHIIVVGTESDVANFKLLWRAAGPRLRDYPNFVRALKANAFIPEPLSYGAHPRVQQRWTPASFGAPGRDRWTCSR